MKRRIGIDAEDSERGAALLLVIAFMVVMGAISAAVISLVFSATAEMTMPTVGVPNQHNIRQFVPLDQIDDIGNMRLKIDTRREQM